MIFSDTAKSLPRWLLLGALVFAPWAYGCTREWSGKILEYWLLGTFGIFVIVGGGWKRRSVRLPLVCGILLLSLVAWMIINAYAAFQPETFRFKALHPLIPALPGTVDAASTTQSLYSLAGIFGGFAVAGNMLDSRVWRNRIWLFLSLTGLGIVAFGMIQAVFHAPGIFWQAGPGSGPAFFSTFRYHGNAGAFINLVFPFILYRTRFVFENRRRRFMKGFWCAGSAGAVLAMGLCGSRAATAVSLLLAVCFIFSNLRGVGAKSLPPRNVFLVALGLVMAAWLAASLHFESIRRSGQVGERVFDNTRYLVYDVIAHHALPVSGWKGFGPGTFSITFPYFTNYFGDRVAGFWRYAHEDYLQTLMEWGWIGSSLWAIILFGGLACGARQLFGEYGLVSLEKRLFLEACVLSLLGVLLHALIDFPLQVFSLQLYAAIACAGTWGIVLGTDSEPRSSNSCSHDGLDAK